MLSRIPQVGERVIIRTPENPRLNAANATVREVTQWGCHLNTLASATGHFRAAWHEMEDYPQNGKHVALKIDDIIKEARQQGYTGDVCPNCGSTKMVMAGKCRQCQECFSTDGGCS